MCACSLHRIKVSCFESLRDLSVFEPRSGYHRISAEGVTLRVTLRMSVVIVVGGDAVYMLALIEKVVVDPAVIVLIAVDDTAVIHDLHRVHTAVV